LEIESNLKIGDFIIAQELAALWINLDPRSTTALKKFAAASRENGDFAAMDESLRKWAALAPAEIEPFIQAAADHHLAGRPDAAASALDRLILRHGANADLYAAACKLYGEIGYETGLLRLEQELVSRGGTLAPVWLARLDMAEKARDWESISHLVALLEDSPAQIIPPAQRKWLSIIQALAEVCLVGESGSEVHLLELVSDAFFPCKTYVRILEPLVEAGKWRAAEGVLTFAEGPYPKSPTLSKLRARITASVEAEAIQNMADGASKPQQFASWHAFLDLHQSSIAQGRREEALERLNETRRRRPDWLAEAAHQMDELELSLIARTPDTLRIQMLARSLATRNDESRATLLQLARELFPSHPEHTRILFQAVIARASDPTKTVAEFNTLFPPPALPTDTTAQE
jgi:tetratricopeptide (TPR) repeat protein